MFYLCRKKEWTTSAPTICITKHQSNCNAAHSWLSVHQTENFDCFWYFSEPDQANGFSSNKKILDV